MAARGSGARPRFVWRTTPVPFSTRRRAGRADASRRTPADTTAGPGEAQEEPALPSTVLLVELVSVLEEGMYRITVEGILNLRSLAGGADTTFAYPEVKASDEDADVAKPDAAKPDAAKPDAAEPDAAEEEPDEPEGEGR